MDERLFTPEEANALVPQLRPLLADLRDAFHEHAFAREQWEESRRFGGSEAETASWLEKADLHRGRLAAALAAIEAMGAQVKDPVLGLADFPARRADGETVLLCYRDDEERIAFWHPMQGGFGARRPLADL